MCVLPSELPPNFLSLCPWGALLLTPFQTPGVQAQAGRGEWAPAQHNQREGERGWSPQRGQSNKTPQHKLGSRQASPPALLEEQRALVWWRRMEGQARLGTHVTAQK